MNIGAHVSIAGGIDKAPYRAFQLGCECFQIFTRPPQGGEPSRLDKATVDSFLKECSTYNFTSYHIHTPYFINTASADNQISSTSISLITEEIKRGGVIGAKYIVTHLGSTRGLGKSKGLAKAIEGLKRILDSTSDSYARLLIENSAGQGETIGSTFIELAEILYRVGDHNLGICLDTAHLLASGYDIRTREALKKILREFSEIIGFDRLKLLHGNDSKAGLGERKDRHEHIGEGKIGTAGFKAIVNDALLQNLDLIIETPLEKVGDDIRNLRKLKFLRKNSRAK
ncbi:MAG TPA: deoxyribonuclease IV [Thermodesulfobacteriota bacterium]|nr:deoxyribonuclease IV [Thermodesulfobacteriota bacterium]